MGSGFQFLDIILFAMIAAFLVLRLRSVLGRRTGHQRRPPENPLARRSQQQDADAGGNDNVIELPDRRQDGEDAAFEGAADPSDPVAAGLTQIRIADSGFDPAQFIAGARAAFEMVVQAFATGDQKTLRNLLNDEVFGNFSEAIKQREEAGETLETTVISIKAADIVEARIEGRMAFVTVKFVSEQVNVTRGKDGEVADGDPNRVTDVTDLWAFARNTRARDPNWMLVETRSPN
jgi:predicted lipid-binding transport protein (Tim44 family)